MINMRGAHLLSVDMAVAGGAGTYTSAVRGQQARRVREHYARVKLGANERLST